MYVLIEGYNGKTGDEAIALVRRRLSLYFQTFAPWAAADGRWQTALALHYYAFRHNPYQYFKLSRLAHTLLQITPWLGKAYYSSYLGFKKVD
jgi:hypothetical protein